VRLFFPPFPQTLEIDVADIHITTATTTDRVTFLFEATRPERLVDARQTTNCLQAGIDLKTVQQ
jgi:hypothetical protein